MSKIDTVRAAMMQAMKDKNKERKDALSLLLSALKSKQIDKRADLTEEEENAVIFREIEAGAGDDRHYACGSRADNRGSQAAHAGLRRICTQADG